MYFKPDGEIGLIKEGEVKILQKNSKLSAPKFSPDGSRLLFLTPSERKIPPVPRYIQENSDNPNENQEVITPSPYDYFGMQILSFNLEEILKGVILDQLTPKVIGTTFINPVPGRLGYEFWQFNNSTEFLVGDSKRIFDLNKGQISNEETSEQSESSQVIVSRSLTTVSNLKFTQYLDQLYNQSGEMVINDISKTITVNQNLYILAGGFLYRIQDDIPVLALNEKLISVQNFNGSLNVITSNQEEITFKFN